MHQSEFIDRRQYRRIATSIRFAAEIGKPLNRFVTLQFGATSCDSENVGPAFRRLLSNHYGPWLRPSRRDGKNLKPAAYVYAVENVPTPPHPHGTHVHWAVHVPDDRYEAFRGKLPHWLMSVAGPIHDPDSAIHFRETDDKLRLYLGKGLRGPDAKRCGVKLTSYQGVVFGRRCAIAAAINDAAILAHRARLSNTRPVVVSEAISPSSVWPDPAHRLDPLPWRDAS